MPGLGELVVFRAPVILRCSPVRFYPAPPLQTMQGGIERPLLYLKYITRYLLDPLGYGPSMLGPKRKRPQDKEVEGTLRKVNPFGRHALPFHFYTSPYSASCRSAMGSCVVQMEQLSDCLGMGFAILAEC